MNILRRLSYRNSRGHVTIATSKIVNEIFYTGREQTVTSEKVVCLQKSLNTGYKIMQKYDMPGFG